MKITAIRTFLCHAYRTNWVFAKVLTDEGLHGVGEATLEYRETTVAEAIRELERTFVGRDPHQIEALWHEAYRSTYFRGGPVFQSALSAVEMALWDIKGKALGVPVYQLLGGKVRDSVPCYANGWFAPAKTPAEFAEKAQAAVAAGFAGLKWDPFGSAYLDIAKADLRLALDNIEAVKAAVGDQVDLLIEGHGRFNVATAVRIARELERFDILWFEEPVPPDNLDALLEVKQRSRVPIAAGERLYSRWEASRFLELQLRRFHPARREPLRRHRRTQEDRRHGRSSPHRRVPAQSQRPGGQRRHAPTRRLHAQFLHPRNHGGGRALACRDLQRTGHLRPRTHEHSRRPRPRHRPPRRSHRRASLPAPRPATLYRPAHRHPACGRDELFPRRREYKTEMSAGGNDQGNPAESQLLSLGLPMEY